MGQTQQVLNKVVIESCRLSSAERGGLFWFDVGKFTQKPELRAASNLTVNDAEADNFRPYLNAVLKTFRTNQPMVVRIQNKNESLAIPAVRAVLCIPIEAQGCCPWSPLSRQFLSERYIRFSGYIHVEAHSTQYQCDDRAYC